MGITRIKLRLEKAYKLKEITKKETLDDCLNHIGEYSDNNRNFEFFWFPHTDTVQTKHSTSLKTHLNDMVWGKDWRCYN